MTRATFSDRLAAAVQASRHDRETPEQIAADYRALAWGTLRGLRTARERGGGFACHMARAAARRHLVSALELAARYRRRAAEASAEARATARTRLWAMLRGTLDAA